MSKRQIAKIPEAQLAKAVETGIFDSIRLWWNGKISASECAKNAVIEGVAAACGVAGAIAGQAAAAKIGTLENLLMKTGYDAGSAAGRAFMTWLMDCLFNDDKSLDNAYAVLGVKMDASKEDVERAYKAKRARAHPDKGGSSEEFIKVQAAWDTIKVAKGW